MSCKETLDAYGLKEAGHWKFGAYKSASHLSDLPGISFVLEDTFRRATNVVYAFVVGDQVLYVGETTNGMSDRFTSYRYGNKLERDNDNCIKREITNALQQNRTVDGAACPVGIVELPKGKLEIPASKPLEAALIGEFRGLLNRKSMAARGLRPVAIAVVDASS
jgi:hypothetical protein